MDLILGTAGHIDHGKTSLIKALTGVDTDRLPEEKKRGITIDLGFTGLNLGSVKLGIIDVPGHERFIRNMLAGAAGIDIALLVVAADDSVMPQTREHLDILNLLNLKAGVIAITKIDLVESELLEVVKADIQKLVAGTFLENAPVVCTSTTKGHGIEELRSQLEATASMIDERKCSTCILEEAQCDFDSAQLAENTKTNTPFRMAIDRTFSIAGHGTIVTGSVLHGNAFVGDTLEIQPGNLKVRVRGIQCHDESVESVHCGQRAAINITGVQHNKIKRGQELSTTQYLKPSRLLTAQLFLLPSVKAPLKKNAYFRLHLGTANAIGSIDILSTWPTEKELDGIDSDLDKKGVNNFQTQLVHPGKRVLAQIYLKNDMVSAWGQSFVIRQLSPNMTIGGGTILMPNAQRISIRNKLALRHAMNLSSDEYGTRCSAAHFFAGWEQLSPLKLQYAAGFEYATNIHEKLVLNGTLLELSDSNGRSIRIHQDVLKEFQNWITTKLAKLHKASPLSRSFLVTQALQHVVLRENIQSFVPTILKHSAQNEVFWLSEDETRIGTLGVGPQLSQAEQKLLDSMIKTIHDAEISPPFLKDLLSSASRNKSSIPELLAISAEENILVRINEFFFIHTKTMANIQAKLQETMQEERGYTLGEIREILSTTRKYAVPICEYLDSIEFTRRDQELRYLVRE